MVTREGGVEDMERLRVLITGGTGFIGANLARYFNSMGHSVAITLQDSSKIWRISDIINRINTFKIDITDFSKVKEIFNLYKPDIVINTAAYGGYHFENATQQIFQVNLNGTINLVEAFLQSNSSLLINTGSSSEYGFKDRPMSEGDIIEPYGSYAVSKSASTLYCRSRSIETGRKIVTFRLFSAFGYYEEPHRLVPYVILSTLRESKAILNNPNNIRDFIFIDDISKAYAKLIYQAETVNNGEIFNLGTGEETTIGKIVRIVENLTGKKLEIEWQYDNGRIGDKAEHWAADISKTSNVLNWKPQYTLEQGLSETYKWFKKHISEYEVIENAKINRYSK